MIFGRGVGTNRGAQGAPDNTRIGAFSDGVFSITITLLVLGLQTPQVQNPNDLPRAMWDLLPRLFGYAVSVIVIGIYWVGQHNMYFHIKRHDRVLLWLNILFLGLVASMPFWTDVLRTYPDQEISVIAYAGTLALIGLTLDLIWRYASTNARLVDADISPQLVAFVHRRVLVAPIVYLLSIAVSFISIRLSELLFIVVAILYIFPNPLDQYHHSALNTTPKDVELE